VAERVVKVRLPEGLYLELVRRYGVRGLSRGVAELVRRALEDQGLESSKGLSTEALGSESPKGLEDQGLEGPEPRAEVVKPPPEPPLPPVPKRAKWGFCPECLLIFAFDEYDRCTRCGSKLIPMDTEENKRLFQELKRKRAEKGGGG
jgi:hypothetical protein